MRGVDAATGGPLSGLDHLRQSVRDVLATPIGSRVMRREYGSRLRELLDQPTSPGWAARARAAAAEALDRWEPRLRVHRVDVRAGSPGRVVVEVHGVYLPDARAVAVEAPLDGVRP